MSKKNANGEGSIFPYRTGYAAYTWVETPDGKRKRKWVYGKTRDEVHAKWITLTSKSRKGPIATSSPSIQAYITYWLEEIVRPNCAPLTHATWASHFRNYILPKLGDKRLDRLRVKDVQEWLNRIGSECQCCAQGKDQRRPEDKRRCCALGRCCGSYPSNRTVKDVRDVLRNALANAIREELVDRNVATLTKLPSSRRTKRDRWTTDEARAFLESARDDGDSLYAAYGLILVCGLRKGEALGLEWANVDFGSSELTVSKQIQRVGRELLHRTTKTEASDDTLPLPEICATALEMRKKQQQVVREDAAGAWMPGDFVFTTAHGSPVDPRNFDRRWHARVRKAGVPRITPHDGRRSCGSLLADLDVHPRVAMRILRHAKFGVTMEIYSEVSSEQTREALKRLGQSLSG